METIGVHDPIAVRYGDGPPVCLFCDRAVYGDPHLGLRHQGETVAPRRPDPRYAKAFAKAQRDADAAVARLPKGASPEEIVRVALLAVHDAGLMRLSPAPVRPSSRGQGRDGLVPQEDWPEWARGPAA